MKKYFYTYELDNVSTLRNKLFIRDETANSYMIYLFLNKMLRERTKSRCVFMFYFLSLRNPTPPVNLPKTLYENIFSFQF